MLREDLRKCFLSALKKARTEDREGIEDSPPCPNIMVLRNEVVKTGEKAGTDDATEIGEPASITDCPRISKKPWIRLSSFWRNNAVECWCNRFRGCKRANLRDSKNTFKDSIKRY